jgi:FkbM family methyltransferase
VGRGTLGDDPVLQAIAARLAEASSAETAQVLAGLIERLSVESVGAVMEKLPPSRQMDYARHPIRLVVSSTEINVRLTSAEKEPFTVEWIERSLEPGQVFYDIGANVGAYALIAAKTTANRARVFAFEPSPASFLDLSRNVALNDCGESVVPLPLALWSRTELLTLVAGTTVAGTPSRPAIPGAAQHEIHAATSSDDEESATIIGVPLDDLVGRFGLPVPTHAKIDTDGYELEVLLGAERTLVRKEWKSLTIELDREETSRNDEIRKLLAEAGFETQRRYARRPTPAFPDPESRPDVYWTFSRDAAGRRIAPRVGRAPTRRRRRPTAVQDAQRRAVTVTVALISFLFLLLVLLPEELGDRPYDVFGLRF